MELRNIPTRSLYTGQTVPCIGMGTFGSDRCTMQAIADAVGGAVRSGYRLIDCAACYGNEKEIGTALHGILSEGRIAREDLFVMSKVWNDRHREVGKACRETLRNLQLDYLDVYYIHWPFPNYHKPGAAGDERNPDSKPFSAGEFMDTYRQLEALKEEGLIRNIGVSNMTIRKFEAVYDAMTVKPAMCEIEVHPTLQQKALRKWLADRGIVTVGYMPLGSPQRPDRDVMAQDVADLKLPTMVEIANAHGVHPAIIALKWAMQKNVIPIPFSIVPAEYESNLEAALTEPLTEAELRAIDALDCGNRLARGQVFLWPGADDWRLLWDGE